jgi:hypothetical protein
VTLSEVKDGWPHYSRRDRLLGLDQPASCLNRCPYSRVTVHPVCTCHQLAVAPFFLPPLTPPLPHTESIPHRSHRRITKTRQNLKNLGAPAFSTPPFRAQNNAAHVLLSDDSPFLKTGFNQPNMLAARCPRMVIWPTHSIPTR